MDDPLQDLENELKALSPRRPSVLLRARVERDLANPAPVDAPASPVPSAPRYTTATTLRSWKWISWQMAAAAAVALTVSLGVWRWGSPDSLEPVASSAPGYALDSRASSTEASSPGRTVPPLSGPVGDRMLASAPSDIYRPVKAANLLYDLTDEGPVVLDDSTHARRVRARYVDTYTWKNPATNASLKWSIPREEVRVMPTNYH